jgi:RNA polymerase sigma factor (sigma-70 family)
MKKLLAFILKKNYFCIYNLSSHLSLQTCTNQKLKSMNNDEILSAIRQAGILREKALQQIYENDKLRKTVIHYISVSGGGLRDAEDVYQDTLILFDRQIREGNFQGASSWETYFIGIAKWRWVSLKRKYAHDIELKPEYYDEPIESVEARAIENEKREIIDEILSKIGERCKTMLMLYKLSYSMEEIAEKMGLSSPELAKKNAYECRKKFKEFVDNNVEYKNALNVK